MINQFFISLLAVIFVGGVSGYLGSLMLTKRMALVGDALGHVALPGMGIALLLGLNVSLGAFLFLLLGILIIWLFELKTSMPMEALVGVVFVASLAIGFLIVPNPELLETLIGDISNISFTAAVISILVSSAVLLAINKLYANLILANISEDLALVKGINAKKYNFLYLFLIAIIVSLGVKVTGSLLVGALVIVPAATARNFSKNLKQYSFGSLILGAVSCLIGMSLSRVTALPVGPLIILVSVFFFIISLFFKK